VSLGALALLLAAAALHTGWNLLVKRAREKQMFTWWAMSAGALCCAPLLLVGEALPARAWPYLLASGLVQALYALLLARAYERADFSLVYPVARGAAPAFLALWAALFLGERPDLPGLAGLAVLVGGLVLIGAGAWWAGRRAASVGLSGLGAALGVACFISMYSIIDGMAVRSAPAVPYTVLVIAMSALFMGPVVIVRHGGPALVAELRANLWPILLVGVLTIVTYMLVLRAYAIAPVSYAGAIREVSVVFAALIGWRWLGEGFGLPRVLGACLIFAGILVLAVAG
jgi:drug/metabolite transporter (DMT)-like permease